MDGATEIMFSTIHTTSDPQHHLGKLGSLLVAPVYM